MAQYTTSAQAALLSTQQGSLALRVQQQLVRLALAVAAEATSGTRRSAYVSQVITNPAGVANAWLPTTLAAVNVAAPGSDDAPQLPTDAELASAMSGLWNLFADA